MPDIFETYDNIRKAICLFSGSGAICEAKREQGIAMLRQWLMETELEIDQFETSQWQEHMEENYQMTIMEKGLVKW